MKRTMSTCLTLAYVVLLSLTFFFTPCFAGDTGAYKIDEYGVTLTPLENGTVRIAIHQKWKVLGGHIPWITVGLPNAGFTLTEEAGGNIASIEPRNSGSWSGVHITLDGDYRENETFDVDFSILQKGLFYSDPGGYRLHFIPGWYKNGRIHHLTIAMNFFTDLEGVRAGPEPDRVEARSLYWEKSELAEGMRFPISVVFPKKLFPGPIDAIARKARRSRLDDPHIIGILAVILFVFVGLIAFVIISSIRRNRYGDGGNIGTGGTAGIHSKGCVVSCACACVACACACACAGGGAAGCDRKQTFACPLCETCGQSDCPSTPRRSDEKERNPQ